MSLVLPVWDLSSRERLRLQSLQQFARRKRLPESAAAAGECFSVGSRIPWSTEFEETSFSLWRFLTIAAIRPNWSGGLPPEPLGRTVSLF